MVEQACILELDGTGIESHSANNLWRGRIAGSQYLQLWIENKVWLTKQRFLNYIIIIPEIQERL